MKREIVLFITICSIIFNSCDKETLTQVGFSSPINKKSNGLIIMHATSDYMPVYLDGFITILKGDLIVELLDPAGIVVYYKCILIIFDNQLLPKCFSNKFIVFFLLLTC